MAAPVATMTRALRHCCADSFFPDTVATAPSLDTVPAKGTVHDAAVAADSVTPTSIAVTIAPTATKTMTVARRLIRIVGSGVA